jgi:hypothetical protein
MGKRGPKPKFGVAMNGTDKKNLWRLNRRLENAKTVDEKHVCKILIAELIRKISVAKPVANKASAALKNNLELQKSPVNKLVALSEKEIEFKLEMLDQLDFRTQQEYEAIEDDEDKEYAKSVLQTQFDLIHAEQNRLQEAFAELLPAQISTDLPSLIVLNEPTLKVKLSHLNFWEQWVIDESSCTGNYDDDVVPEEDVKRMEVLLEAIASEKVRINSQLWELTKSSSPETTKESEDEIPDEIKKTPGLISAELFKR